MSYFNRNYNLAIVELLTTGYTFAVENGGSPAFAILQEGHRLKQFGHAKVTCWDGLHQDQPVLGARFTLDL